MRIKLIYLISLVIISFSCSDSNNDQKAYIDFSDIFYKSKFSALNQTEIQKIDSLLHTNIYNDTVRYNCLKALGCTYSYLGENKKLSTTFKKL